MGGHDINDIGQAFLLVAESFLNAVSLGTNLNQGAFQVLYMGVHHNGNRLSFIRQVIVCGFYLAAIFQQNAGNLRGFVPDIFNNAFKTVDVAAEVFINNVKFIGHLLYDIFNILILLGNRIVNFTKAIH